MSAEPAVGVDPQQEYLLYCDGAARGNPGPAAAGYVLIDLQGRELFAHGDVLGDRITNNVAEYTALVRGLDLALRSGVRRLGVRMDSELVVRQVRGEYKVRHPGLKPLFARVCALLAGLEQFHIEHVPRAENARADALANAALDDLRSQ